MPHCQWALGAEYKVKGYRNNHRHAYQTREARVGMHYMYLTKYAKFEVKEPIGHTSAHTVLAKLDLRYAYKLREFHDGGSTTLRLHRGMSPHKNMTFVAHA